MIVFRYLSREVLLTLSAVSAVLLVIIMSGRFIKYLAQAASGQLDPGSLFLIMGFRLPGFLQLILPLGLFLGILGEIREPYNCSLPDVIQSDQSKFCGRCKRMHT